jgi:hypothetical protein
MVTLKRISLLLAVILVASLFVFIATTFIRGQTVPSTHSRITVLRRKDQLNVKPTAEEIALFRRQAAQEERALEDKIPKHVPLKIKIRAEKEKSFKDLNNEKWMRDFELEVTNTSGKPIYFLELWLEYPEVISENGHKVGVPLRYGRMDFIHFDTLALPTDIPIKPGETIAFTIPEQDLRGWLAHKLRENRQEPKKIEITFAQLSYGDGSGFNGTDARPYPYKRDKSSSIRFLS